MFRFLRLSHFVILSLCFFSSTLFAAQKTDAKPPLASIPETETVYVYASRLPSSQAKLRDMTSNVTWIRKETLDSKKSRTLQEAVQYEEGVFLYDQVGNGIETNLGLRGFNQSNAAVVLVDGVRMNDVDGGGISFPLIGTDELDSIQISRGSSSPIYGSNAFSGVVNIQTSKPSEKPVSLFGGLELASHRGIHFYNGLSGTVQDKISSLGGKAQYYFRGGRKLGDGFRGNADFRITDFDIKTAYLFPEDAGKVFLNLKSVDDMISNPGELTREQYDRSTKRTNKPLDRRSFRDRVVQLGIDHKFWDQKIGASLMASWRRQMNQFFATTAGFDDFPSTGPNTDLVKRTMRDQNLVGQLDYQDQWDWFSNHSLAGFEMRKGMDYSIDFNAPGSIVDEANPQVDRVGNLSNYALFWNEEIGFYDRVKLHVGMRHDRDTLKVDNHLFRSNSFSERWNSSTVHTGIVFNPIPSDDIFFNFSEGFKIPSISNISPFTPGFGILYDPLRPEQSKSYEVGNRYRFRELFQLNFSWFLIDLKDEIILDGTARTATNAFGQNVNIGKSRRQGIETGLTVHPAKELDLFFRYTLTSAYVRETNGSGSIRDGRTIGQIPQNQMNWGFELTPLARLGEYFSGLKLAMYGRFVGRQHPTSYESSSQADLNAGGAAAHWIKSYNLWDLSTSYKIKGQEIYFKINNIFDNKYYSRAVTAPVDSSVYGVGTYTFVNPGAPREYLLGLRWEIE